MPKWPILQCGKIPFGYKLLVFSILYRPFIIRVFASEGEPVRKFALIFRGRVGNYDGKIKIRLQSESCTHRHHFGGRKQCLHRLETEVYILKSVPAEFLPSNIAIRDRLCRWVRRLRSCDGKAFFIR